MPCAIQCGAKMEDSQRLEVEDGGGWSVVTDSLCYFISFRLLVFYSFMGFSL